jgi:Erg28 like protein
MLNKENLIRSLQGWICVVGLMALGNTISCFVDHSFLGNRLYTAVPLKANDLTARLFGMWTLVSAILRITCAFSIDNRTLYNVTFASFVLAFGHFMSEVFVFRSATLTVGVLSPLIVSSISMVWMLVCYRQLFPNRDYSEKEAFPKRVEDIQLPKLLKSKRPKAD